MELGDFIAETLTQIVRGIQSANAGLAPDEPKARQPFILHHSLGDQPQAPHIEFDVAVTTQSEISGGAKGKGKLFVVGAELEGSTSISQKDISRVKFSVVVKHHQG